MQSRQAKKILKKAPAETSKVLKTMKGQVLQAQKHALETQAKEALLRTALASLGTQQGHAVFVKNQNRQFLFANNVLLKGLVSVAQLNGFAVKDGHVKWEDVYLKTDKQLRIECDDYIRSDDIILSGEAPHFEGFEKNFDTNAPEGSVIWTRKEPMRDGNKIVGVVGYVVPGLPIEIQNLTNYIFEKLPVYASIKNERGHVIWANDRHLKMLAPRIDELLKEQKLKKYLKYPLQAKLRAINNNHGPTDKDLYGDEGTRYSQRDQDIIARARAHTGEEQSFESTIDDLIRDWYKYERDGKYPDKGWMEFHRFPGTENARWVEVWKMPWWEEAIDLGQRRWRVKGVLVFFQDRHKHFLRKSVIWRWLETHLKQANEGSARMLKTALSQGTSRPEQLLQLSSFGLPRMLRRMLVWFKAFVDETHSTIKFTQHKRTSNDLALLLKAIQESYSNKVIIRYYPPNPHVTFHSHGDDLFSIIIAVAMNAVEATMRVGIDPRPAVIVRLVITGDTLLSTVADEGECPKQAKLDQINSLKALKESGEPGGGFFLAKRLAAHLTTLADKANFTPDEALRIKAGPSTGAEVVIRLPSSVFAAEIDILKMHTS